jgi:hypothetical protein
MYTTTPWINKVVPACGNDLLAFAFVVLDLTLA